MKRDRHFIIDILHSFLLKFIHSITSAVYKILWNAPSSWVFALSLLVAVDDRTLIMNIHSSDIKNDVLFLSWHSTRHIIVNRLTFCKSSLVTQLLHQKDDKSPHLTLSGIVNASTQLRRNHL